MSESDTMFNKRDRRCAAVQPMLSTDPNYDNRTITSTLKMHIWIATNNRDVLRVMKTKFPATVMVFGVVSSEGHIMPPHIFEVSLKVNTKWTWMGWRVWWSLPSAEYPPSSRRRLWKRHAPSSGSVSRRWLRLKAATLNRCQLNYIIKLSEMIFL